MKTKQVPDIIRVSCYGCIHGAGDTQCEACVDTTIFIKDTPEGHKKYIADKTKHKLGVK